MSFVATSQQGTAASVDPKMQEFQQLRSMVHPMLMARYPDIVQMIFESSSLSFTEKQYWLRLLPLMNKEQIEKLREILSSERARLREIQQRYDQKRAMTIGEVQQKKLEGMEEKKKMIKKQEELDQLREEEHEDELLRALSNI